MTTQNQYNVLRQAIRKTRVKIDLLNRNEVVVDSLEGITTDGGISISADSSHRRSGSITMVLDKKYNLMPSPSSKIWFDKRCALYIGVDSYLGETVWFKLGRFAIDDVSLNLGQTEKTVSLQLKDYMSFLDGTLGGEIAHQIIIPAGEDTISNVIRAILSELGGVTAASVENIGISGNSELVPYELEKPSGTTVYELVKELVDMYKGYDLYYNVDGYLIIERTRDRTNDPIIELFDGKDNDFTIDSSTEIDFKNVKNSIWVWGELLDSGNQIMWVYRNRFSRESISRMNAITSKEKGDICYIKELRQSYVWNGSLWELLDFNVVDIFNIENIDERIKVSSETSLQDEEEAKLQAEYELKNYSNFAESLSISCVPLYNLDVNNKIHFVNKEGIEGDYLITDITVPLDISSAMSITATKLYV